MSYLVDTNILTRLIVLKDPLSQPARAAIDKLQQDRAGLLVAPQNLIEFWAVATRPVSANGLGLSVERAAEEVTGYGKKEVIGNKKILELLYPDA